MKNFLFLASIFLVLVAPFTRSEARHRSSDEDLAVLTLGITFPPLLLLYTSMQPSENVYRMHDQLAGDAALFVGSGGSAEPGAMLRAELETMRTAIVAQRGVNLSDLEIAEVLLTRF